MKEVIGDGPRLEPKCVQPLSGSILTSHEA